MIKSKFVQYVCVFLLGYSMLGGLLVPLSPAIESAEYSQSDSSLEFTVKIPRLKEEVTQFYLSNSNKDILSAYSVNYLAGYYLLKFDHPKQFQKFKTGNSLDLFCQTKEYGDLYYFSAFFIDSNRGERLLPKKLIDPSVKPFSLSFPNRMILKESIRNLFFHVPMWFTMIGLLIYSLIQSILFLNKGQLNADLKAEKSAFVAMIFGTLGILTGMIWAKFTWGAYWTNDPKLNGAAIGMLAYLAYFVLRGSIEDEIKRAKLAAVYNIFSFTIYMVFIMVLPRINDSLHPGNGGNPGFNIYEQDNVMRLFFYPAVIGWGLLGFWLTALYVDISGKKRDSL